MQLTQTMVVCCVLLRLFFFCSVLLKLASVEARKLQSNILWNSGSVNRCF